MSLSDEERPMFEYSSNPVNLQRIIPSIPTKKVREAVRELKKSFCLCKMYEPETCPRCKKIDEIFGEKLI